MQCKIETCLKKKQQESIPLVKDLTSEKQVLILNYLKQGLKYKSFSADVQKFAQNHTFMRVVVTMQFWTAVSTQNKMYNRSSVKELRFEKHH